MWWNDDVPAIAASVPETDAAEIPPSLETTDTTALTQRHRSTGRRTVHDRPHEGITDLIKSPKHSEAARSAASIVVADHHWVVREGLRACLAGQAEIKVIGEAQSSAEVLGLVQLHQPDVVVTEIDLPCENGLSIASVTHKISATARVVAYTRSGDSVDVRTMLAAGARGYVLKASPVSTLVTSIGVVRLGSRFLDPALSDTLIEQLGLLPAVSPTASDILTVREAEVLKRLVWGFTSRQIAVQLGIEPTTVNTYRTRLCEKTGLKSRNELIRLGVSLGLMKEGASGKTMTTSV